MVGKWIQLTDRGGWEFKMNMAWFKLPVVFVFLHGHGLPERNSLDEH